VASLRGTASTISIDRGALYAASLAFAKKRSYLRGELLGVIGSMGASGR
jgi:hypothetical protein